MAYDYEDDNDTRFVRKIYWHFEYLQNHLVARQPFRVKVIALLWIEIIVAEVIIRISLVRKKSSWGIIIRPNQKRVRSNTTMKKRRVWDKKKEFILVYGRLMYRDSFRMTSFRGYITSQYYSWEEPRVKSWRVRFIAYCR